MAENIIENKLKELEKQLEADRKARLEKTVKILKEFAEKEMAGKEKEDFLKNLGEEPKNDDTITENE